MHAITHAITHGGRAQIQRDEEWWDKYSTNRLELEDVSMQILDLYDYPDSILCEGHLHGKSFEETMSAKHLYLDSKGAALPHVSPALAASSPRPRTTPELRAMPTPPPSSKRRRTEHKETTTNSNATAPADSKR